MKRLNNKGYMIVEIIVSATIAMTIAYFMMDLVVKLKEKYDYVQNETILMADKTVITNEILGDLYSRDIKCAKEDGDSIIYKLKDDVELKVSYETVKDPVTNRVIEHWIKYYEGTGIIYQKKFNEVLQVKEPTADDISVDSTNNIASFIIKAETLTSTKNYGINIILPVEGVCF